MAEPRMSTFIVGLIFISAVAGIFALMMSDLSTNYGVTYSDNESTEVLNKLDNLKSNATSFQNQAIGSIDENQNIFEKIVDLTGAALFNGIKVLKITFSSFDIFETMATTGLGKLGLGETQGIIQTAIITAVIITIIVGIILSSLVKREL